MTAPDPVFNEASLSPPAADPATARRRMKTILAILIRAPDHGFGSSLRISHDFYLLELSPGHSILNWLDATDPDERRFFMLLATRAPYLRPEDGEIASRLEDSEITCAGCTHPAFLTAHELDSALVSFPGGAWAGPELLARRRFFDDEGELCEEEITLINIAQPEHFQHHETWIEERFQSVATGAELWRRRTELYPSLIFCPAVEKQLSSLDPIIPLIANRLAILNQSACSPQPFNKDNLGCTCRPTASTTRDKYRASYTFQTPDGESEYCGWHLLLPEGRRIYFAPGNSFHTIGRIGSHLPTMRFP
jgi:hypothetical protein